jgi:hypothetical protein
MKQSWKHSSRRWVTAVIHQLLLIAWDLWQFLNNSLHGETGHLALAQHAILDAQIAEDITIGSARAAPFIKGPLCV